MEYFNWIIPAFWLLISLTFIFLVYGFRKKSWKLLFAAGLFSLFPSMYFGGTENWFRILAFLPLIFFLLAYYFKKIQ